MARVFRTDTRIALLVSVVVLTGAACSGIAHAAEDTAHLLHQLHDQDIQKQRDAAKALSQIEPVSSETLQTMITIVEATGGDNQVRDYAQSAICNAGTAAIPTLQRWVQTGGFLRQIGVNLLGCLAPGTPDVWPILLDMYKKNRDADAMTGLAGVGKPVLPLLFDQLRGSDPEMRKGALRAIDTMAGWSQTSAEGQRGHKNRIESKDLDPVLPELTEALKDSDPETQGYAAFAFHYADSTDLRVLPIFSPLVMEEDGSFARSAIEVLMGVSDKAVRRYATSLEQKGYLVRVARRARTNQFDLRKLFAALETKIAANRAAQTLKRTPPHDSSEFVSLS